MDIVDDEFGDVMILCGEVCSNEFATYPRFHEVMKELVDLRWVGGQKAELRRHGSSLRYSWGEDHTGEFWKGARGFHWAQL